MPHPSPIISSQAAMILVLLGAPGSGKGTQAKRLASAYQIPHVSTGDLFRENMSNDTVLGRIAKDYIQSGHLVPDELVLDMLSERITRPDCKRGYLLDGFPRTISQAESLTQFVPLRMRFEIVSLNVPDDVIIKRAAGRLICKKCNTIYNQEMSAPVQVGICDKCEGEVYQRADDAPQVVKERLKVYHHQTQPLLNFYQEKGLLTCFDGNQEPDIVYNELKRFIDGEF